MRSFIIPRTRFLSIITLLCAVALFSTVQAQQNQPQTSPEEQVDDVVKINTNIVQTDVTVLDKQGRFVDNLKREEFELLIDGKPQPITFFERVTSGSMSEEAQIAVARGNSLPQAAEAIRPSDRGRTIFFFVDDIHMAPENLLRVRKTLLQFIDQEMGQNDQVAITSATGQVGFLQQLTDNKAVLHAAIARLTAPRQGITDMGYPRMTEALALAIEAFNDRDALNYFVEPMISEGTPRPVAENIVKGRAKQILQQSNFLTKNTLASLESLTRTSAALPGRKLVFFLSDGFFLNNRESDMIDRLRNITNAAARTGVVIYTLDARGLSTAFSNDAVGGQRPDTTGRMARFSTNEISSSQEPLAVLAANTGGRALLNSNSLSSGLTKAIQETSVYYLLAWRPETEAQRKDKFRQIEVKVNGHPELNVMVRRGYYDLATKTTAKRENAEAKNAKAVPPDDVLRKAIQTLYPLGALPTQLGLVYTEAPDKGLMLMASIQIARQFITFIPAGDKQIGELDILGLVLNEQGKSVASVKDNLKVSVASEQQTGHRRDLVYNFQSPLAPGLYQVRVAARDLKSGRTGSAMQWIEIPDLSSRQLALNLLISETTREAESQIKEPTSIAESVLSVSHRFARTSKLRFLTFIYNSARGADGTAASDVALQVQVLRDDQPVITTALRKVKENVDDPKHLAYVAEIPLESLVPGRYVLQITVIDRIAKTSAAQRANFEIE